MQPHLFVGILLVMLAGAMCGNCMTPLRQVRTWKWENAWLVFSFVSLVLIPGFLAAATIPHIGAVYSQEQVQDDRHRHVVRQVGDQRRRGVPGRSPAPARSASAVSTVSRCGKEGA